MTRRDFPGFASYGLLGGVSLRANANTEARVLIGPAYMDYDSKEVIKHLGGLARADISLRMTAHFAFVMWAQGALPPLTRNERLAAVSAGFGLRIR
ncbi:MAG: hypothetical protein H7Z40_10665 [Phycisphaerae bacterium]|nr:hypothetical protein [Gemmatimonadaceae bacterium]